MLINFCKMQSLGNDFVIIDRTQVDDQTIFDAEFVRKISNRNFGIGCDLVVLYKITNLKSDTVFVETSFFNSDGSEAEICGNATRCIGVLMNRTKGCSNCIMRTTKQEYKIKIEDNNSNTSVYWDKKADIEKFDLSNIHLFQDEKEKVEIINAYKVSVGNPHLVLFLKSMPEIEVIKEIGAKLEKYHIFPNKTNVEFAVVSSDGSIIELRVFERGVGLTLGCGSGAMAVAVAAEKYGIISGKKINIHQLGGNLEVDFLDNGDYVQIGKAEYVFSGNIDIKIPFSLSNTDEKNHTKITIYTDGACSGNPGPGGWGAVLINGNEIKEISGGESDTTNNRMELTAVIRALENTLSTSEIELYTDSQYVKDGITKWIKNWLKNDWKNSQKQSVKNKELWERLLELSSDRKITWNWVRGHAGNKFNEQVDTLARKACSKFSET